MARETDYSQLDFHPMHPREMYLWLSVALSAVAVSFTLSTRARCIAYFSIDCENPFSFTLRTRARCIIQTVSGSYEDHFHLAHPREMHHEQHSDTDYQRETFTLRTRARCIRKIKQMRLRGIVHLVHTSRVDTRRTRNTMSALTLSSVSPVPRMESYGYFLDLRTGNRPV